ncbi:MAG: DUF4159 domain-containing protein [Candidatus Latescibacterota bacterium]
MEAKAFGEYLRSGGFALFDNLTPWEEFSPAEASLRQFIKDALGSGVRFEPIPNDDPIYHSYFDFHEGPPIGSELQVMGGAQVPSLSKQRPYLEGVRIHGRLVAVFSNKGYGNTWLNRGGNDAQLRMGVNFVVFALLQEGGKAVKLIDEKLEQGKIAQRNMIEKTMGEQPASRSSRGGMRGGR